MTQLRKHDTKWTPNDRSGMYEGSPCGPFLARLGQTNLLMCVVGANGEISADFEKLLKSLVDKLSPEAVRQWRLEGESGARLQTRGTIGFLVRRRLAGAIYNSIGNHFLDRLWWIHASRGWAPGADGNGPRPGFDDSGDTSGADRFSDAYSRFAGRGSNPSYRYHRGGGG